MKYPHPVVAIRAILIALLITISAAEAQEHFNAKGSQASPYTTELQQQSKQDLRG